MSIGFLALGLAPVLCVVCLLSADHAEPKRKPEPDYSGIYKKLQVKEI